MNPELRRVLVGTALGAGLGGATGYLAPQKRSDKKAKVRRIRRALVGGLVGGGLGASLSHVLNKEIARDREIRDHLREITRMKEDFVRDFRSKKDNPKPYRNFAGRITPEDRLEIIEAIKRKKFLDLKRGPDGIWSKEAALRVSILLKLASKGDGKGWGEGESIKTQGLDRFLRMMYDNERGGPRYTTKQNLFIKMIDRREKR